MPADDRVLEIGQIIELKVIAKDDSAAFSPIFMDYEPMLFPKKRESEEQWPDFPEDYDLFIPRRPVFSSGSVRFFNPVKKDGFSLRPGEIWTCKIKNFRISNSRARDERRYIFFEVEILGREETTEHQFDEEKNEWVTRVMSGEVLVREYREPAERKIRDYRARLSARFERYYGQQDEIVVSVEEIWVTGKKVRQKAAGAMRREKYERSKKGEVEKMRHPFGKSIDPKTMRKMLSSIPSFESLSILPADIEFPADMVIY